MNGIGVLKEEALEVVFSQPCEDASRRQLSALCKAGGGIFPDTKSACDLILRFPFCRTVENKCSLFFPQYDILL